MFKFTVAPNINWTLSLKVNREETVMMKHKNKLSERNNGMERVNFVLPFTCK